MMLKGKAPVKGSSMLGGGTKLAPVLPVRGVAGVTHTHTHTQSSRKELLDSRLYRRTVADHAYWENYLTTDRYFKNMLSLPSSRIIRALAGPLASVALTSTIVCTYETLRSQGILPPEFPSILMPNNTPLQLTSFAVSLLLVFRTNQSYDRWWEARKIWGGVLNRVRDIVTQAVVFIPEDEKELRIAMRNWTIAFTRTLEAHLQGKLVSRDLKSNLENVLSPKELDMVMNSQHKVVKCLSVMGEISLQAPINSIERQMLMGNVQTFYDYLGMCERIMRTPLPLTYTRHTARFLFFWICSLPFALYGSFGWGCIPIALVISTLLLGIDEIGVQIEEPFGVLPLDAICARAEIDMRSIVADQPECADLVREMKPAGSTPPKPRQVPIEAR
ncbi:Bestrophin, RFP-TM, chloride channel-domain-containing protein [Dunaliella salina]|uniref:Bestrophin, RFP-TM, chloride channel-domain-containing protein n=1 Tax=Dunaliella salina TaxID=3046 RepID=A0ABQ7H5L6_DUNSA|nr:Bestrophin, RFP-TM, chloride channel-domain-containing protein [Dunaliella salina]|eukprot:KAF5842146.1 Bestrophin, RFP-TM, chloride channel-domain-containing protein [Dunaliella salina]